MLTIALFHLAGGRPDSFRVVRNAISTRHLLARPGPPEIVAIRQDTCPECGALSGTRSDCSVPSRAVLSAISDQFHVARAIYLYP